VVKLTHSLCSWYSIVLLHFRRKVWNLFSTLDLMDSNVAGRVGQNVFFFFLNNEILR
jgi:hypothetical protein